MMTTEEIRAELQDVRYYYSRKAMFDRAKACVAKNAAVALAEKYGNAVRDAPPRLYDIYVTLYVENNTQASAAEKWGYSEGYIRNLNKQLYAFFVNAFANKIKGGETMATKSDLYAGLTNAYRTRHYIVFQEIGLCDDEEMGTFLFSVDGYYRRTKQRDADYERRFRKRQDVDGQRIPVGTYIREYVD